MDDIGAIVFLIIFAISLIGSLIQKMSGTGQQESDDERPDRPERPRASDLPAATRRQIYGTGSPRAAEADEDDEADDQPVVPIPVQNLWQQQQQRQGQQPQREQRGGEHRSTAPPPLRREAPSARSAESKSFRPAEQAPWRPADQAPTPEAAQLASSEAAERARRQRESQRQRARSTARGGASADAAAGVARLAEPKERLASNEERMRVQRQKMVDALKKREEVRSRVTTRNADFRSAPVKRKPKRSAQLSQLRRLMRNERAIRTGFIFSEVLGKPKALREDTSHPSQ